METINQKQSIVIKLRSFIIECKRIWQVTKKPSKTELITIVKVTGIGMLVVGFLGFLVNLLWQLLLR